MFICSLTRLKSAVNAKKCILGSNGFAMSLKMQFPLLPYFMDFFKPLISISKACSFFSRTVLRSYFYCFWRLVHTPLKTTLDILTKLTDPMFLRMIHSEFYRDVVWPGVMWHSTNILFTTNHFARLDHFMGAGLCTNFTTQKIKGIT